MEDPRSHRATEMRALSRRQREALAEVFGLDTATTVEMTIEFGPGMTMVQWTGRKALDAEATSALMARLGAVE